MAISFFGRTLNQILTSLQASNVTTTPGKDQWGQRYEQVEAALPNGGRVSAKVVPSSASQFSFADVFTGGSDRVDYSLGFSHGGTVDRVDTVKFTGGAMTGLQVSDGTDPLLYEWNAGKK